jgi:undecaprenyl-diphosphatase
MDLAGPTRTVAEDAGSRPEVSPRRQAAPAAAPVPVLDAPSDGPAARVAGRLDGRHPAIVFTLAALAGYVLLAALAIGLGLLLVDVLLPFHGLGRADEHVNRWFAAHRDGTLNDASYIGSMIGDSPVLPVLVALTAAGLMLRRHRRIAGFVVAAILVEAATYRIASLIVHRERPAVPRLDHLPVNQSFPSGHVAASLAVYGGLAVLLTSAKPRRGLGAASWIVAALLVAAVAVSRMYRGMHHPLDVAAGLLVGAGAVLVALFAARASGIAERRRATPGARGSAT